MHDLARVACALGDPLRLRILDLLVAGRHAACCSPTNPDLPAAVCACDIALKLECEPSKLAYHMGQLRSAGLVNEQRRGRWVYYSVAVEALAAFARALVERWPLDVCNAPCLPSGTPAEASASRQKRRPGASTAYRTARRIASASST